ncbi:MAG TPA: hypothetical protein VEG63_13430 [Candidatus Acidoferrales bacterium]|nr:hypothetical protein [Candidatus Acidoferrales bacterium]
MRRKILLGLAALGLAAAGAMRAGEPEGAGQTSLTVYNQMFAVVRQMIPLELKAGANHVTFTDITAHMEPDSVILRDPSGARRLLVLEQNYRNDPVSQERLLALNEGKTIEFITKDKEGKDVVVMGKIVRSGYLPHYAAMYQYGQNYAAEQYGYVQGGNGQPIIEVNGKLQFSLPGMPVFPALADDTILKPTLDWQIETDKAGSSPVELSYVTGGMRWEADYNVVAPEVGDVLDVVGWVTLDNQSGKSFPNSRIKLMAGDVSKLQGGGVMDRRAMAGVVLEAEAAGPPVTERKFDEYHLYTLERPTTLLDRETKQVEFIRASGIESHRVYVYDGAKLDRNTAGWPMENIRNNQSYGTQSNPKVWVLQEFKNSAANHLGIPLPKGRVRFYRRDKDGQVEFTGENVIDHTPKDEMLRFYTGNAFDLVGERRRTYFKLDNADSWIDESFEIKLRNHTNAPVEIRVVEHLYRWTGWEISQKSAPYEKLDAQTIQFLVTVPADGESKVTYMVHYTW